MVRSAWPSSEEHGGTAARKRKSPSCKKAEASPRCRRQSRRRLATKQWGTRIYSHVQSLPAVQAAEPREVRCLRPSDDSIYSHFQSLRAASQRREAFHSLEVLGGCPKIDSGWNIESACHDSYNGIGFGVDLDGLSEDVRVSVELVFPESAAKEGNVSVRQVVLRSKLPAHDRRQPGIPSPARSHGCRKKR